MIRKRVCLDVTRLRIRNSGKPKNSLKPTLTQSSIIRNVLFIWIKDMLLVATSPINSVEQRLSIVYSGVRENSPQLEHDRFLVYKFI